MMQGIFRPSHNSKLHHTSDQISDKSSK